MYTYYTTSRFLYLVRNIYIKKNGGRKQNQGKDLANLQTQYECTILLPFAFT